MKITLVRHGADEQGFRGGWSQRGLTELGIRQVQALAEYLHLYSVPIDAIISSDLRRAAETAEELVSRLCLSVRWSEDWREFNNGLLAGMPEAEAEQQFPGLHFDTVDMDESYPRGESPNEFLARITRAFREICHQVEHDRLGPNVVIVTHGGPINIVYHLLEAIAWTNKRAYPFPTAHTSLHEILFDGDCWRVVSRNKTPHLAQERTDF